MEHDAEVEAFVSDYYDVMRRGGSPVELLSPDLTVAIGTDDEEWSTSSAAEIRACLIQFDAMSGYEVSASNPRGHSEGALGWFEDRALFTLRDGVSMPVRFTGVVRQENGRWRAVQTHLSMGTPNAEYGLDLPRST